jgi:Family of unknown function (DUF6481)
MAGFKLPDFNERAALSRDAKAKALEKMRAKPAIDPAVAAERAAARERKEAAEAEKRRLRAERQAQEKADREAAAAAAAAAEAERLAAEEEAKKPKRPVVDEALAKALRDAKYAKRKARK